MGAGLMPGRCLGGRGINQYDIQVAVYVMAQIGIGEALIKLLVSPHRRQRDAPGMPGATSRYRCRGNRNRE